MKRYDFSLPVRSRRTLLVSVGAILLLGVALLWRALLPPTFEFNWNAQTMARDDVYALSELKGDLEQILKWEPDYITHAAVEDLARWIKTPGNEKAKYLTDLYRYNSFEFTQSNGQIHKLDQAGVGNIEGWSKWPLEKVTSRLSALLRKEYERERDAALLKTVRSTRHAKLLQRRGIAAFPERSSFTRWLFAAITGAHLADRMIWAESFSSAFDRDVRGTFDQYVDMDRNNAVRIDAGGAQIVLTKRRGASVQSTTYRGTQSTSDFDVAWKPRATDPAAALDAASAPDPVGGSGAGNAQSSQAERVYDTGIRLVCLGWKSLVEQGSTKWQPQWPPAPHTVSCIAERTREFLVSFGAPSGLLVNAGTTLVVEGDQSNPTTSLHAVVSAIHSTQWSGKLVVRLDGRTTQELRREVIAATAELRRELVDYLASESEMWGSKVELAPLADDRLSGTIDHPVLGQLSISGTLQPDWTLVWKAELSRDDRQRCIDKLIEVQPSLSGYSNLMSLSTIQLDSVTGAIRCQFGAALNDRGEAASKPVVMEFSPAASKPSVAVPAELPVVTRPAASDPSVLGASGLSHNELARAAQQHLKEKYPQLEGKFLFPRISLSGDKIVVLLELTIEDWPLLALGPIEVGSVTEVGAAMDELLQQANVVKASAEQWKQLGEIDHPRFGKVVGEIVEWSAGEPYAVIRCAAQLKGLGQIPWHDRLQIQDNGWSGLDDSSLADDCEQHANTLLNAVRNAISEYLPAAQTRVEVDPTGLDGLRWLSVRPLRIALKAVSETSIYGLEVPLRVGGIIVDRDGLHMPEEFGFEVPTTIPTPYLAFSRPLIMFSFNRPALRIGGHITPPTADIGPNMWVGLFSNEVSLKGYWENRRFEGASRLTIAHQPDVATGGMVTDFDRGSLIGEMRGGGRIPGFDSIPARVGGRIEADRASQSMSLDGRAELLNVDVAELSIESGNVRPKVIDPRLDDQKKTFSVAGRVGLPAGLSMDLAGQAGSDLAKYTVQGSTQLLNMKKTMTATEKEVRWENETSTPNGTIYWDDWNPSIGTLRTDEDDTSSFAKGGAAATEAEVAMAKKNFRRRPTQIRLGWKRQSGATNSELYQSVSNFKLVIENQELVCSNRDDGALIVRVAQDRLPSGINQGWTYLCWRKTDGSGAGHLLLMQLAEQPVVWHIEFSGPNSIAKSSAIDFPKLAVPAGNSAILKRCINRFFTLGTLQSDMTQLSGLPFDVDPSTGSVAFDYCIRELEEELPTTAMFCMQDALPMSADLHPTLLGRQASTLLTAEKVASIAAQLKTLSRFDRSLPRLVYLDGSETLFGWYVTQARGARQGKLCLINSASPQTLLAEIDFEAEDSLTLADQLRRATTFCSAAGAQADLKSGAVWFGRKGLLAVSGEQYFLLLDRGDRVPQVDRFKKNDFVTWPDVDTRTMLPEEWATEEQRRTLTLQEIGRKALSREFSAADRTTNPISWLGLLQALASRSESNAHE